jgi:hypothetical protein
MTGSPSRSRRYRCAVRRLSRAAIFGVPGALAAQGASGLDAAPDTATRVTFGAFVDAYYAYDVNRPRDLDRAFTTQPARHNEFNVNLAFVEATLGGPRVRGRLALQAGTSVQANYAGEPTTGAVSGPLLSRHLQEAVAGYEVAPGLWIDAGVFFSHVGMESWVSRDNPTYTRSLVADYSPYYSAGVKATWQTTSRFAVRLDLVNGWQNVSESNSGKSVGARLDYTAGGTTASYYTYVGGEGGGRLRVFNGVGVRAAPTSRIQLLGQLDVGRQGRDRGASTWYGGVLVARVQATRATALVARVERFADPDQVVLVTGDGQSPFRANGASLGLDVSPDKRMAWRTEVRGFRARGAVFPHRSDDARSRSAGVVVSSLAVGF